jgi:hypothetical protein
MSDTQREQFEKWLYKEDGDVNPDGLTTEEIEVMFLSWQASAQVAEARNRELSEALREVMGKVDHIQGNNLITGIIHTTCVNALSTQPTESLDEHDNQDKTET